MLIISAPSSEGKSEITFPQCHYWNLQKTKDKIWGNTPGEIISHMTYRNTESTERVNISLPTLHRKVETSLYRVAKMYSIILNRLGVAHACKGRTDGQTDRQNGLKQ